MALQTKTFSTGSFAYGSESNGYVVDLVVTEESVDAAANTSFVTFKLQLRSGANNRFTGYVTGSVTVLDREFTAQNVVIEAAYNKTYTVLTGSATVPHKDDGSLALSVSAFLDTPQSNPYAPPDITVSGALELTVIPRPSAISATSGYIGQALAIAVSRYSAEYTHTVAYRFGSLTGYLQNSAGTVGDTPVQLTDTTLVFPLPEDFYQQIPDAPSGECTLTCQTYRGSHLIGTTTATFTAFAREEVCLPLVTAVALDENPETLALTGDGRIIVKDLSRVVCTPTATAQRGATIAAVYVNDVPVTEGSVTLEQVTSADVTVRAVDSRGFAATYTVPDLQLVAYAPISCSLHPGKTSPDGTLRLVVEGKWYPGSFGLQDNTLTVRYRADEGSWQTAQPEYSGDSFTVDTELTDIDYTTGHTVWAELTDSAGCTVIKSAAVSPSLPVFHWGQKDFAFNVPVFLANGLEAVGRQQTLGASLFTGDANDVLDDAFLVTTTGAQNCSSNGLLLVFGWHTGEGRVALQLRCDADGTHLRYRLYWYNTWTSWKEIA